MDISFKKLKRISYVLTTHDLTKFNHELFYKVFYKHNTFPVESHKESNELLKLCLNIGFLRLGYDKDFEVSIPCQLFSKSKKLTIINKLSLIECLFQEHHNSNCLKFLDFFNNLLAKPMSRLSITSDSLLFMSIINVLLAAEVLVEVNQEIMISDQIIKHVSSIVKEYESDPDLIISSNLKLIQFDIFSRVYGYHKYVNHIEIDFDTLSTFYNKHLVQEFKDSELTPNNGRRHSEIQDIFRRSLLIEFEFKCAICDISGKENLVASHIVPVSQSDNLMITGDYHNGLLLCKQHDRLFDQGLVSFDDDGLIMISTLVLPDSYNRLHINPKLSVKKRHLSYSRLNFFRYHRDKIFRK